MELGIKSVNDNEVRRNPGGGGGELAITSRSVRKGRVPFEDVTCSS